MYILKEQVGLRISVTVQGRRYRSLVRSWAYGSSSTGTKLLNDQKERQWSAEG
ncbi:unnamed protein product [Citrullus colocynthis]|uniref:Uncharacterized protein n=1 Tax=Citrullus colocynthis TaxID=252529 RepID=A0ABP0YV45_9ROSI